MLANRRLTKLKKGRTCSSSASKIAGRLKGHLVITRESGNLFGSGVRKKNSYLPYIKSLFLGRFEPLRDAIAAEPATWASKKQHCRPSHAPFFEHLPADKMAVITMHNLMGLLMTNSGGAGAVKVVQSACAIGEALENEVKIHRLLEKTSKKSIAIKKPEAESDTMTNEQETLTTELEQEKLTKEQRPSYIVYQIAKNEENSASPGNREGTR